MTLSTALVYPVVLSYSVGSDPQSMRHKAAGRTVEGTD